IFDLLSKIRVFITKDDGQYCEIVTRGSMITDEDEVITHCIISSGRTPAEKKICILCVNCEL
uniref:Uncharacterized protein n=1 Tax=Pristionchus pacificus TaxID=54126 RepID=A0A2A6CUP9_PRIPA